jgi:hypothetical protein
MDKEAEEALNELTCVMWAIRTVAVELLADKLEKFADPKKAADLMTKRVYKSYETSSLPEPLRLKIPEHVVSILDDATTAALNPHRKRKEGGEA